MALRRAAPGHRALRGRVFGFAAVHGGGGSLADVFRRRKVGLADRQVDDAAALLAQFGDDGACGDAGRQLDALDAISDDAHLAAPIFSARVFSSQGLV
ncbi:hypothetical protein G6F32_015847 [Rhizopus arrhizus]|nr:hypothetical protein G6F32_015847 [Rhizopus arrhizus]